MAPHGPPGRRRRDASPRTKYPSAFGSYAAHASHIAADTWNRFRAWVVGAGMSRRIAVEQRLVPDPRDRAPSKVGAACSPRACTRWAPTGRCRSMRRRLGSRDSAPPGYRTINSLTCVAAAQAEVDTRVLGRAVARARLHLADEPAPVGQHGRHHRPGCELREAHLEPVARGARRSQQLQRPANRADRDVDAAVVVEVGRGKASADDAREAEAADEGRAVGEGRRPAGGVSFSSTWIGCAFRRRFVTGMPPFASARSRSPSRSRSTQETPQPVNV